MNLFLKKYDFYPNKKEIGLKNLAKIDGTAAEVVF